MSATDKQAPGYPAAHVIQDYEVMLYCGGMGGGGGADFLGTQRAVYKIKNNKFTVRNRLLLLYNEQFEVNVDAGANGFGGRNVGARLPIYWAAVANPAAITNAQVIARGDVTNVALPYYMTLDESDLPQPTDPAWDGNTYVILVWTDPNAVSYSYQILNEDGSQTANLVVVEYQQDVRI